MLTCEGHINIKGREADSATHAEWFEDGIHTSFHPGPQAWPLVHGLNGTDNCGFPYTQKKFDFYVLFQVQRVQTSGGHLSRYPGNI